MCNKTDALIKCHEIVISGIPIRDKILLRNFISSLISDSNFFIVVELFISLNLKLLTK